MFKRKIPLAWKILTREKLRLLTALSGISFAVILMFMQLGFQNALYDSNTRLNRALNADIVLLSSQARNMGNLSRFSRRRLYEAMNFAGVESAQPMYISTAEWKNPITRAIGAVLVVAFDPTQRLLRDDQINIDAQNLAKVNLADYYLLDRASRPEYKGTVAKLEQGETVTTELRGRRISISGLFTVGASFAADSNLVTSDLNFLRIFPDRQAGEINIGLVKLEPGANLVNLVATLQDKLPKDVQVLTYQGFVDKEKEFIVRRSPIGFIFRLGTAMGFVVGIIIVYQILYSDVSDHLAEYATLKAMGYSDLYLLGVVFQEALFLSFMGYIPGLSISFLLYNMTKNATRLPMNLTAERAVLILGLTVIMCCISGFISMRKLQAADPADIF